MMTIHDITKAIENRFKVGRPYKDESLEAKRLKAIEWLRTESGRGWVCDQIRRAVMR